ncbi:DegV family EDD domain-containing protein [Candidatus Parcubacteria bacterium]|nr:DegV family EDD domain-containing protein [Candidatus Parcubacteria bacterium]
MKHLTQKEFKKMIFSSYEKIEKEKEQINKINVFPVPDQDTGDNLAATLKGIKQAIENKDFNDLEEFSQAVLNGALSSAQGNAGVIYTGFLSGFLPCLDKNSTDAKKLALAFEKGKEKARQSIQNPTEGTILDVIEAATETIKKESEKETDIITIFRKAVEKAHEALLATREKMEIFRKANVVDAGGLGFLMILESHLEALEKPAFVPLSAELRRGKGEIKPSEQVKRFVQILANRYEVVALIEDPKLSDEQIKKQLGKLGNSLVLVRYGNKMKIHIHTDYPDQVKKNISAIGKILNLREEDMAKEVAGEESVRKVSIGIVTEDITALLPKIIEKYQIELAFAKYDWQEGENLPGENIYQKMREADKQGIKTFPKTSQATPKSYLDAYEKQLNKFDKVLCITITSKLSGCYNSAKQAETMVKEPQRIFVFDSLTAAAGEALLVLRAIEIIQEQKEISEVIKELKNLIPKIYVYVIFADPKWIEAGGRITKSQANWIRRMKKLHFHPLMAIKNGLIAKAGIVWAKDMAEALFKKIARESKKPRKQGKKIRVVINHADNIKDAEKLRKMLKQKLKAEVSFISLAPAVICAQAGPGALLAAWHEL